MRTSIRTPQTVRIVVLVALISLLYSYFAGSNANNPRRNKNFRRPKFKNNKSPVTDIITNQHNSEMASQYLKNIAVRRSIYALSKESPVPNQRIQEILTEVLLHTPSSFNNQAGRAVLLVGDHHDKLWNLATTYIRDNVPKAYDGLKSKLEGYKASYGTVMFFEDSTVIEGLKAKNPSMPFDDWSKHSQGMLHIHAWDALELEGFGANLQHYNMFPDLVTTIRKEWELPESWELHAQLVFGKPVGGPKEKTQTSIEQRLKVFGA